MLDSTLHISCSGYDYLQLTSYTQWVRLVTTYELYSVGTTSYTVRAILSGYD